MEKEKFCYKCGAHATSREHVPPNCLFPEAKDVRGLNFRKDLITVPSCDEHNSNKSTDDEFLLFSIASIVGNNYVGYIHTQTKITRALRRKSKDFIAKKVIRNASTYTIEGSGQRKYIVSEGSPDYQRLLKCFEHISAGLYFHEFGKVFQGETRMLFGFIKYNNPETNTFIKFIRDKVKLETVDVSEKGANPEVFTYQFCPTDEYGLITLKMKFYNGAEVFVCFNPTGSIIPYNMANDFIGKGIHTIIKLGDKHFSFNEKKDSMPIACQLTEGLIDGRG